MKPPRLVTTIATSDSSTVTMPAASRNLGATHNATAQMTSNEPISSADTPPSVWIEMTMSPSFRPAYGGNRMISAPMATNRPAQKGRPRRHAVKPRQNLRSTLASPGGWSGSCP